MIEQAEKFILSLACLFASLAFASTTSEADTHTSKTNRNALILLVRDLSLTDVHQLHLPAEHTAYAAMNCVPGKGPWEQATALAMATGVRAEAGPHDLDILPIAAPTDERDPAGIVFKRRTGVQPPDNGDTIVHLGIAPLIRRGLENRLVTSIRTSGPMTGALAPMVAYGTDQFGAAGLMVVDEQGVGQGNLVENLPETVANSYATYVVVDLDAGKPLRNSQQATDELNAFLDALGRNGYLTKNVIYCFSYRAQPGEMGVVLLSSPDIPKGVLTSATTRTKGVVALADVAPTILDLIGAPQQSWMEGHRMEVATPTRAFDDPQTRNLIIQDNALTMKPFVLGIIALGVVGVALALIGATGNRLAGAAGLSALLSVGFSPLTTLPNAIVLPIFHMVQGLEGEGSVADPTTLFPLLFLIHVGLLAASWPFVADRSGLRSVRFLAALLTIATLADAYTGQNLMKLSLLGEGAGQGIRYYGIGNEYMGLLLAAVLVWSVSVHPPLTNRLGWLPVVPIALTLLALALPSVGADAGGLVAAVVAVGCLVHSLKRGNCPWWIAALWSVVGLALAFGVAWAESRLSPTNATHIGSSLSASRSLGLTHLWDIALRKGEMSLRILTHPLTVAVGVVIGCTYWAYEAKFKSLLQSKPGFERWKAILPASGWGSLAAILFNDSGAVSALIILGGAVVSGLFLANGDEEAVPNAEASSIQVATT